MNDNAKEWKLVEKALYLYMSENEKKYLQKTARMYNKKVLFVGNKQLYIFKVQRAKRSVGTFFCLYKNILAR